MMQTRRRLTAKSESSRSGERGWALLGLMLALSVMSIFLVSAIVPNVQLQVQRDKEAEMVYRGEQMALGIARYYSGRNRLLPLQIPLILTPVLGPLELKKLRDGVNIGSQETKFVRASALIDPMNSADWEPVRARDPRLMRFLQAWAVENPGANLNLPPYYAYLIIAGPPPKSVFADPTSSDPTPPPGSTGQGQPPPPGGPGQPPPGVQPTNPQGRSTGQPGAGQDPNDPNNDPLADLFGPDSPGQGNIPIVGVAPKKKGNALRPYFGLDRYEDWVFIYIPVPQGTRVGPTL